MKKLANKFLNFLVLVVIFAILGCNSEDAGDCFKTTGDLLTEERLVAPFSKIFVNEEINLIIKQDTSYKVIVETGTNLMNAIEVAVVDDQLILTNHTSCNYIRDYNVTTIYVTAPDISEIRSSTQRTIRSEGVLTFSDLSIISENYQNEELITSADFYLNLVTENLGLVSNGSSNVFITGSTQNLSINIAAGDARFEGVDFIAQNVNVYHRGTNDLIINAIQSVKGTIHSTGDLVLVNQPSEVEVVEHYTGQVLYTNTISTLKLLE